MTSVHVLGVRHHGPGSARSVAEALDELRPDLVLIEGPPELDALHPLAGDPDLVPPVAALVYASDEPQRASFYPMAAFSPEWVALRWAAAAGVPQRFIDLPASHRVGIVRAAAERAAAEATGEEDADEEDAALRFGDADDAAPADEPATVPADPITTLARVAGYDDPERWWEDAVEQRSGSALERFAAIAEGIAELRADEDGDPGVRDDEGELDFDALEHPLGRPMTGLREAAMRRELRAAMKEGHDTIVVVCGAWHAPALDPAAFPPVAHDSRLLRGLPKAKMSAAWVPWTANRLSLASGYGAGVTSPGWYRHLFDHWATGADHDAALGWLVRVARELRAQGIDASTASVVDAARLATNLAALRGRPSPGLTELYDAALGVLADGNPLPLQLVDDALVVGHDLGSVPESAPLVPLAADLAKAQKSTRLKPGAAQQLVTLDLRTDAGRARSLLLHRLRLLDIDWGEIAYATRTTGTFKEQWQLEWRPELAIALVEASLFGTTILGAATAKAAHLAADASVPELSRLIDRCLVAEIPVHEVVARLAELTAVHTDVLDLLDSIEPLARVSRYGTVRRVDTDEVVAVLRTIVVRACVGLPVAAAAIDAGEAARLLRAVDSAHAGLTLIEDEDLLAQWHAALGVVAARDQIPGLVAGRATRLLLDAGLLERDAVAVSMRRWLSLAHDPGDAAGWLDGFLAGSAVILVHDPALLSIVDGWVAQVEPEAFDDLLPLLRRTFSEFAKPERRMIGERVSRGAVVEAAPAELRLEAAGPALATVAGLLGWKESA